MAGPLFEARFIVYWSESDAAGIAHFTTFFKMLEWTEEELLRDILGEAFTDPDKRSIIFPRVHASCDYKAPLRVHDTARISIDSAVIGKTSITWLFTIHNETLGVESAKCKVVAVSVEASTLRPIEVPSELKEALLKRGAVLRSGDPPLA